MLVPVDAPARHFSEVNWSKKSLRYCLTSMGLTHEEMRYRAGARYLIESWTGEIETLIDLVKKKWKAQVIPLHEANGGDHEQWKNLNSLYSSILRKLGPYVRKNPGAYIDFECQFCKRKVRKMRMSWMQEKSILCDSHECLKAWYRLRAQRYRARFKTNWERFCEYKECGKRFITTNSNKKFCSKTCFRQNYRSLHPEHGQSRQPHRWQKWFATLTEEQKEAYRKRHVELKHEREVNRTPEQMAALRAKRAAYAKIYRDRRKAEGNPVPRSPQMTDQEWMEKKRQELIDKPWLFETIVLKHKEIMKKRLRRKKAAMKKRWAHMSPEERELYNARRRERWRERSRARRMNIGNPPAMALAV